MSFKEFVQKLSSALRGGVSTDRFTRSLFDAIVSEGGQDILDDYQPSSYKGFYNGNTSISGISKKINAYVEPMEFSAYIYTFPDAAVENLCSVFAEEMPDIDYDNVGDKLAELFVFIITEAAGATKKSTPKGAIKKEAIPPIIMDPKGITPDLGHYRDGVLYFDKISDDEDDEISPFEKYIIDATSYYSTKKTLLYAEKPHPFYDLYVCNDIRQNKFRTSGIRDSKELKTFSDATVKKLEKESRYIIIEGIGGIGKSMFLTHLFLSSAKEALNTGKIPLFLSLKDYRDTTSGIVDFLWKAAKEFDSTISQRDIIQALQNKCMILLLDGLDEIQSSLRDSFNQDLEAFIKSYPGNTIIITSRPIYSFISYSKFSLYDIQPLSKNQAIELVRKLEFWDLAGKNSFLDALNNRLYHSHYQFASNPLLLTIMLMTYSSFGEVPAKMHVFYSKAYETMARLHDASKGSFKRPLHTNLTPEEFSKYFAQFCARTYKDEVLEFDSLLFSSYMSRVLKGANPEHRDIAPRDFLLDLTDHLCIMYHEGEKYYFIHRSFQEYFAAVYFASEYDANLNKVGRFFEKMKNRSYSDRTFDMLYDMIPEKVERFVFLPFLEELITECSKHGEDEYWEYLERIYPSLYYEEGCTGETSFNESNSFLYKIIAKEKSLDKTARLDLCAWPNEIYNLPTKNWVEAYTSFLEYEAFDKYPVPEVIPEKALEDVGIVAEEELPYKYSDYFGTPDSKGITIEIEIYELRKNSHRYILLRQFMEQDDFPLFVEYQNVKKYYNDLKDRTNKETDSDNLFDD